MNLLALIRFSLGLVLPLMSQLANAGHVDQVIGVGSGADRLDLELSFPSGAKPRAVVVIIPGSGGLSDPYFDAEIQRPTYSYTHRGGLTDVLTAQGYAVAAYSVRGNRGTSCIPSDTPPAERAKYFVSHCVNQETRAHVALNEINQDTRRILEFLGESALTSQLDQIAIAYSEGMYHLADAYSKGKLPSLIGIISIGGPYDSLSSTVEYQVSRAGYVSMIDSAFSKTSAPLLSADQIIQANSRDDAFNRAGLVATMGGETITRTIARERAAFWRDQYQRLHDVFAPGTLEGTMDGNLDGTRIDRAWSAKYYSQMIADDRTSPQMLRTFRGTVVYFYGSSDMLVELPTPEQFRRDGKDAAGPRELSLVPHVDHGLASRGFPAPATLDRIVSAIARSGDLAK